MSNVQHIFAKHAEQRQAHRWSECEERAMEAVASFERGETKHGITHLAHALIAKDRPDPVTLRRIFREVTQAAEVWKLDRDRT